MLDIQKTLIESVGEDIHMNDIGCHNAGEIIEVIKEKINNKSISFEKVKNTMNWLCSLVV